MHEDIKDYYDILDVPPSASQEQIDKARKQWAKLYHRDKLGELDEEGRQRAEKKLAEINAAYDVIGRPEKRRAYDQQRAERNREQTEENIKAEKEARFAHIQELYENGDIEGALKEAKSLFESFSDDALCQNQYAALLYEWAKRFADKGDLLTAAAKLKLAADYALDSKLKAQILV